MIVCLSPGFALFSGITDGDADYSKDKSNHWEKIIEALPPPSKVGHYRYLKTS